MFIFGYLILALAKIIYLILMVYFWIVIARAVLSWVNPDPYNPIVRFIHDATEPVLSQLRRRIPVSYGGIDFAPMVIILIIIFLNSWLVPSIERFGGIFIH